MGVNTFLLDRRTVTLSVEGQRQKVGTLRRFYKLTEMDLDETRQAEIDAAEKNTYSPVAVMLAEADEARMADNRDHPVSAHLVLGWDEGRGTVTDYKWDFLPILGYAVRAASGNEYKLYEKRDGLLHHIDATRARELSLVDAQGRLLRRGQPVITTAANVRPFLDLYADADCTLSNGEAETITTQIEDGKLPPAEWFIGKRPMDVVRYPASSAPLPS